MAVGAYENQVVIYSLKSMEDIRNQVQINGGLEAANFMPIKEEMHVRIDGLILKMEFLHPSKGDEHHVILLLIVSKRDKSRFVRIEWDSRSGLTNLEKKPGQVLAHSEQLPLLLIPLTYATAFAVVCERHIVVYNDILTGNARGQSCQLELNKQPEEAVSSSKSPIWTQWARPMRPKEGRFSATDNIYLCREDGVVRYIDLREDTDPMISTNYEAGVLKANLSNAFAALDLGNESNDLLVAAGDMGDGGMWYLNPRQPPHHIGTIRNWTPLRDTISAQTSQSIKHTVGEEKKALVRSERLFACSGRGPRDGAITEIRYGTEASKLGPAIDLGELAQEAILNMWTLPDRSSTGIYLMITHSTGTELILLPSADDQNPRASDGIEELDLNVRTIAAGSTAEGLIIQVTQSSINVIAQEQGILPFTSEIEGAATAACFLTIPGRTTVLLTVVQEKDGSYLHLRQFGSKDGQIASEELGEPLLLRSEVSAVSVQWIEDCIVAFVGTLGTLQCYTAPPGSSLAPYFEHNFADPDSFCESIAMISNERTVGAKEKHLLLCGHRQGTVDILHFNVIDWHGDGDGDIMVSKASVQLGCMPVKVVGDTTRRSRAIVACEGLLYTLEYSGNLRPNSDIILNRVLFTNTRLLSFQQGSVSCFTQAACRLPQDCSQYAAGSLVCLTGSNLLLADISPSPEPQMVPRRLPVHGTPIKVIYSERLERLVVIYISSSIQRSKQAVERRAKPHQRSLRYALAFVDPHEGTIHPGPDADEFDTPYTQGGLSGESDERLLGVMEWYPTDGHRHYHMLVVNTAIGPTINQQSTGRLLLFSPSPHGADKLMVKFKRHLDVDGPVWSVAHVGKSSLVYACGDDIVLQTLDMSNKKFGQPMKVRLSSPGRYISVQGANVHVSTASAGYHNFSIDSNGLVLRFADASDRCGVHHIAIPEKSVVMVSDLECRIAGLWLPWQPRLDKTAPLLFEASLPNHITRLCKVTRPIRRRDLKILDDDAIIGTTEDGTVYQMALLEEPVWRFLAFIQNMAKRDPRLCPFPHPRVHERHIEPSTAKKRNMHIDGDILIRLIQRGGAVLLQHLLSKEADAENALLEASDFGYGLYDYASAQAREDRFWELAHDAMAWVLDRDLGAVTDFLGILLMPAL
ncbi:MAG: hypothetical protein Q9220_003732 [cf. Caloplaca sp. 1 TL-2023]